MSQSFENVLIERVKRAEWFSKVGTGELSDYVRVANWTAALSELQKNSYVNAETMSRNAFRETVANEYQAKAPGPAWTVEWKKFCEKYDAAMTRSRSLAEELAAATIAKTPLEKDVLDKVVRHFWQHLMITLGTAELFGDDAEHLNRTFVELFLEGYFPCGYRGKYPNGKIVVY
ncbi:MAG: hypothetical protein GXY83_40445 [Rhodopirellula sp.]|nr:hypothetical protein [Rhodopirellula sp.]